jgi:hypothetical protein
MYSVVLRLSAFVPHTFSPYFSTSSASLLTCFHLLIKADNANKNAVKISHISVCFFACYAASVYKKKSNVMPFPHRPTQFSKELPSNNTETLQSVQVILLQFYEALSFIK